MFKTLTFDSGKEFAKFAQIEQALGVKAHFSNPHHWACPNSARLRLPSLIEMCYNVASIKESIVDIGYLTSVALEICRRGGPKTEFKSDEEV